MTTFRLAALSALSLTFLACGANDPDAPAPTPVVAGETPVETPDLEPEAIEPFELFGEALDESLPITAFAELVGDAKAFAGKKIVTNGVVRASCMKRGCWMEVRPEDDRNGTGFMVRFKDYGFFVPLNSRATRVKFQAVVNVVKMSPAQVREHEMEGGTVSEKEADGSATVVMLLASGVEMRGRKTSK